MIPIITLIATLVISLLVTRIGSVALTLTGMSQDAARFQARSAYTGVGYTTSEAEQVVNHPVRRRIVMGLMLLGNIGIAVVIASMMSTFAQSTEDRGDWWYRLFILATALLVLWILGTTKFVDQAIERIIEWALKTWTKLDVHDYVSLLHLVDGYVVCEIHVNEGDWIAEKSLSESRLSSEGVLILGIHRSSGKYVGSPFGKSIVHVGDSLTVYGPVERLEELDIRKQGWEGDRAHKQAMAEQEKVELIATIEEDVQTDSESPEPESP